jgi:hypothetical protein
MRDRRDLIALCISRGGFKEGARVAEFISEWEIAVRKHAGPIGIEEFSRWWKDSRPTAYRRLITFRELFPELGPQATPQDLMRPLLARIAAGEENWQQLDSVDLALP